jgi:hypothetical protein
MKFSRPINREVDIDGNTFVVTVEETGIGFRLKGKRKTARVEWTRVLQIAEGEQGERASEFLGFAESSSQKSDQAETTERMEQIFEPETGSADNRADDNLSGNNQSEENQADDTHRRTATAGETSET